MKKAERYKTQKTYFHIKKWVKKFQRFAILKLKKINFTTIKLAFFSGDVDSEKTLPSHRILFGEINYR